MVSALPRAKGTSFHILPLPVMRPSRSSIAPWRIVAQHLPASSIALPVADGSHARRTPTIVARSSSGFQKMGKRPRQGFTVNWSESRRRQLGKFPGKSYAPLYLFCSRWKTRPTRRPAAKKAKASFSLPASAQQAPRPKYISQTIFRFLPSRRAAALAC